MIYEKSISIEQDCHNVSTSDRGQSCFIRYKEKKRVHRCMMKNDDDFVDRKKMIEKVTIMKYNFITN